MVIIAPEGTNCNKKNSLFSMEGNLEKQHQKRLFFYKEKRFLLTYL